MAPRTYSPNPEAEEDRDRESPPSPHPKNGTSMSCLSLSLSQHYQEGGEASSQSQPQSHSPPRMGQTRTDMRYHRQASVIAILRRSSGDGGTDAPPAKSTTAAPASGKFGSAFDQLSSGGGGGQQYHHPGKIGPGNLRSASAMLQHSRRFNSSLSSSCRRLSATGASSRRLSVESQSSHSSERVEDQAAAGGEAGDAPGNGAVVPNKSALKKNVTAVEHDEFAERERKERAKRSVGSILKRLEDEKRERVQAQQLQRRSLHDQGAARSKAQAQAQVQGPAQRDRTGREDSISEDRPDGDGAGEATTVAERVRGRRNSLRGSGGDGDYGGKGGGGVISRELAVLQSRGRPSISPASAAVALGDSRRSQSVPRGMSFASSEIFAVSHYKRGLGREMSPFDAADEFVVVPPSRSLGQRSGSSSSLMGLTTTRSISAPGGAGGRGSRAGGSASGASSRGGGGVSSSDRPSIGQRWAERAMAATDGGGGSGDSSSSSSRAGGRKSRSVQQQQRPLREPRQNQNRHRQQEQEHARPSPSRPQRRNSLGDRVMEMLRLDDEASAHLSSSIISPPSSIGQSPSPTSRTSPLHPRGGRRTRPGMATRSQSTMSLTGFGSAAGGLRRPGFAERRRASDDGGYRHQNSDSSSSGWDVGCGVAGRLREGAVADSERSSSARKKKNGSNDALDIFAKRETKKTEPCQERRQERRGSTNTSTTRSSVKRQESSKSRRQPQVRRSSVGKMASDLGGSIRNIVNNASSNLGGALNLDDEVRSSRERERRADAAGRRRRSLGGGRSDCSGDGGSFSGNGSFGNGSFGHGSFSRGERAAALPDIDDDAASVSLLSVATSITARTVESLARTVASAATTPPDPPGHPSSSTSANLQTSPPEVVADPAGMRSSAALRALEGRRTGPREDRGRQVGEACTADAPPTRREEASSSSSSSYVTGSLGFATYPVNFGEGGGGGGCGGDGDDGSLHDVDPYALLVDAGPVGDGDTDGRAAAEAEAGASRSSSRQPPRSSFHGSGDNLTVLGDARFKVVDGMIVLAGMGREGSDSPHPRGMGGRGKNEEWSSVGGGGSGMSRRRARRSSSMGHGVGGGGGMGVGSMGGLAGVTTRTSPGGGGMRRSSSFKGWMGSMNLDG